MAGARAASKASPAKKAAGRHQASPPCSPSKVAKSSSKPKKTKSKLSSEVVKKMAEDIASKAEEDTDNKSAKGDTKTEMAESVEETSCAPALPTNAKTTKKPQKATPKLDRESDVPRTLSRSKSRSSSPASGSLRVIHRRMGRAPNRVFTVQKVDKKAWPFTHIPPRQDERRKNGRYEGRNLVIWTRPRMCEKLVLHLQYEMARHKIDVPWDAIAHRLHPGSSGSAITQFLNRLRPILIAEGHLVPPALPKPGSRQPVDPTVRGVVRLDMEGSDTVTTRPVQFTEPMEDRKFNLPDAFDSMIVNDGTTISTCKAGGSGGRGRNGGGRKKAAVKDESPDPADLDSDADYDPAATVSKTRGRRSSRAKKPQTYAEEGEEEEQYSEFEQTQMYGEDEEEEGEDHDDDDENEVGLYSEEAPGQSENEEEGEEMTTDEPSSDEEDANGESEDEELIPNHGGDDVQQRDISKSAGEKDGEEIGLNDGVGFQGEFDNSYAVAGQVFHHEAQSATTFPVTPTLVASGSPFISSAMFHQGTPTYASTDVSSSPAVFYPQQAMTAHMSHFHNNAVASSMAASPHNNGYLQANATFFDGTFANSDNEDEYELIDNSPSSFNSMFSHPGNRGPWGQHNGRI